MKTVLVVDDSRDQRVICSAILRHAGYNTIEAEDGHEAVLLAQAQSPDLVLLDLMLPHLHGLTTAEVFGSVRSLSHVPIIGMTGYDYNPDDVERAGFAHFFTKPILPDALIAEVERLIGPAIPEEECQDP